MPIYSHSRLSAFEKCPLAYRYRYIERIKRDTESIEAFTGKRVHEALEKLYRDLGEDRLDSLDELITLYRRNWDREYSDRVVIVKWDHTADHYRKLGERCIDNYYQRHCPFDRDETVGLEERFHLSLDGADRYQMQGYIDRVSRVGNDMYEIHDYKTSSGRLPSEYDLRGDRQLALYQMAVSHRFPEARAVRLVWHYLFFGEMLEPRLSAAEIENHRRQAIRLIDTIEAAREHPPRESALCRWCEYRDICPVQKEAARAEAAVRAEAAARAGAAMRAEGVTRVEEGAKADDATRDETVTRVESVTRAETATRVAERRIPREQMDLFS